LLPPAKEWEGIVLRTRGISVFSGLLVLAVALVGCGGGGVDSSTGPTISKAAFIKKADAVCMHGNSRMEAAFADLLVENKKIQQPSQADQEALVGEVLVPNIKREIKEIRAFGVPDGDEDRVEGFLEALEEGVETAERNPKVVVSSSEAIFGIPSRLAKEYGLEVCGSR
jgi:hypothetical protein